MIKFKVGDRIRYKGSNKRFYNRDGVIVRKCGADTGCRIIKYTADNITRHTYIKNLVLNNKNKQLLFSFMEK